MIPIDYRNDKFDSVRKRLSAMRERVYNAWLQHGPGSTRTVAKLAGIDILTFRPRSTELYQIGALELMDCPKAGSDIGCGDVSTGREGIYRARSITRWQADYAVMQRMAQGVNRQQQLL
jgi:hypothetical protein